MTSCRTRGTFGDGGTATGPIVNHPYAAAGTYPVILTVVDDRGGIDDHQIDVTVDDPPNIPPTAVLEADCALLTCSFDASDSDDSDGTIESYDWDFGDGTTGSGVTVDHDYAEAGPYHVTLTVTDDDTATGFAETDVEAIEPGAAALFRAAASGNSQSTHRIARRPRRRAARRSAGLHRHRQLGDHRHHACRLDAAAERRRTAPPT